MESQPRDGGADELHRLTGAARGRASDASEGARYGTGTNPRSQVEALVQLALDRRDGEAGFGFWTPSVVDVSAPGSRESVDQSRLSHPHALNPEHPTEGIEVAVVVQNARAAPSGRCGDQVIGRGDASLASQLA